MAFTITVSTAGTVRRSVTTQRELGAQVTSTQATPERDGFVGALWTPTASSGPKPAVVVIGGSEGGLGSPLLSAVLASHGYPTLNIAYFRAPSLPGSLQAIPIEYFARAVDWLRRQPNVDPAKITVMGASRGSEAAMLVAEHYPDLVHSVVGLSPSNVSLCSFPGCAGPAWTFAGAPVPFTRTINQAQPTDASDAILPVANISGPVLLACGDADRIWTSCPYAPSPQSPPRRRPSRRRARSAQLPRRRARSGLRPLRTRQRSGQHPRPRSSSQPARRRRPLAQAAHLPRHRHHPIEPRRRSPPSPVSPQQAAPERFGEPAARS